MIKEQLIVHITYLVRAALNDIQAAGTFILLEYRTHGLKPYATETEMAAYDHLMYIIHYYQQ